MLVGTFGFDRERSKEHRNRFEAVSLAVWRYDTVALCVTADGEELFHPGAVGSEYQIVEVPGADSERFRSIEALPRIGSLEAREAQKTFVDKSHDVAHLPAVLLFHGEGDFLLGLDFGSYVDDGMQMGGRFLHEDALHAEQAYRSVILRIVVRLYQSDGGIYVWSHSRLYGY